MTWTATWMPVWMLAWAAASALAPRRWQPAAMATVGIGFLAWADWRGLAAITGAALATWFLLRGTQPGRWRTGLAIAAVVAGFAWTKLGVRIDGSSTVAILGCAFAVLRIIHVVVERADGRLQIGGLGEYLRYLLFFPAVIAGPVHRLDGFQRDERRRRWDPGCAGEGMERILFGYVKIVTLAGYVDARWLSALDTTHWNPCAEGWFWCLRYGWNLYFQFAGYSDIAIGLALFAGYRLPENFSFPFLAVNIQEFWRRWHASLSAWCRAYVADPMIAATRNRWLAVVTCMLVLGLWHEFSLRYCAWGLFHGIGIALCQWFGTWKGGIPWPGGRAWRLAAYAAAVLLTQAFVLMSFAITRSQDLPEAGYLILRLLGLGGR